MSFLLFLLILFRLLKLFMGKVRLMIQGFEQQTEKLTDYEKEVLLPVMVKCLERKIGKENAVTNAYMCVKMNEKGYEISEVRIRKIINHIRTNWLVPRLMASNAGYYVTNDADELRAYITSLKGREEAIKAVREAVEEQLEELIQSEAEG